MSLEQALAAAHENGGGADEAFAAFEEWAWEDRGLRLYPAQEEAVLGITLGSNVILATPTGTGKSLVAMGAHFIALVEGRRTVYTAPIKALVSEKFFDLVGVFGRERVGMITGDTSINPDAPILCCTASEILANLAIRDKNVDNAEAGGITQVVMDEFHYYADADRGWAWQVPLLLMQDAQFLLMSATLGDVTELAADLSEATGRDTALVTGVERPVPLSFRYEVAPAHEVVEQLIADRETPAYLVHFNQSHAVEQAQALASSRSLIVRAATRLRRRSGTSALLQASARHCRGSCARASECITRACCRATAGSSSSSHSAACSGLSAALTRSASASMCPSAPS